MRNTNVPMSNPASSSEMIVDARPAAEVPTAHNTGRRGFLKGAAGLVTIALIQQGSGSGGCEGGSAETVLISIIELIICSVTKCNSPTTTSKLAVPINQSIAATAKIDNKSGATQRITISLDLVEQSTNTVKRSYMSSAFDLPMNQSEVSLTSAEPIMPPSVGDYVLRAYLVATGNMSAKLLDQSGVASQSFAVTTG